MTTSLPLPRTPISSPGKSCLSCAASALRSCRTLTSKVEIAPALSQTNIEMVPGFLPWMSSCAGAVTSASAMSGTVSETRAIGRADIEHGRPSDHQVDFRPAHRVADDGRRRGAGRVEDRLLRLRRGNEDHDDVHDQRREEGGRPPTLQGPRSARTESCVPRACSSPPIRVRCGWCPSFHDFRLALVAADHFDRGHVRGAVVRDRHGLAGLRLR